VGHIPHLLIDGPWAGDRLEITKAQRDHVERVLRLAKGDPVSYTNGVGDRGSGIYAPGLVVRGEESWVVPPSDLVVVTAPPTARDRLRFMVEKLAELGVAELRWLDSAYSQGRFPPAHKTRAWSVSALEQSRGSWSMRLPGGKTRLDDLVTPYAVCDPSGDLDIPQVRTLVVGPEGGWAPDEVPAEAIRFGLGDTTLRVETAAIVAVARMI
jgi:16S rRNA (uracil1498-N3)-methyltransferase